MCDWEEKEYAEYLLWVKAARPKAPVAPRVSTRSREIAEVGLPLASSPVAAEA